MSLGREKQPLIHVYSRDRIRYRRVRERGARGPQAQAVRYSSDAKFSANSFTRARGVVPSEPVLEK